MVDDERVALATAAALAVIPIGLHRLSRDGSGEYERFVAAVVDRTSRE